MITDGIFTKASGSLRIQKILGTATSRSDKTTGIFYNQAPKEAITPQIVFSTVSSLGSATMDGPEAFTTTRFQFSCYSQVARESKALARAVRMEFEGYQGELADGTDVFTVSYVSELDLFDPAPMLHHVPIDLEFLYGDLGTI